MGIRDSLSLSLSLSRTHTRTHTHLDYEEDEESRAHGNKAIADGGDQAVQGGKVVDVFHDFEHPHKPDHLWGVCVCVCVRARARVCLCVCVWCGLYIRMYT